jgi:hypothetical protein
MAVVSRITDLRWGGINGTRRYTATATTQDTAAGQSVVVTIAMTVTGIDPPDVPDTLSLSFRVDSLATVVRTATLTPGSASQQVTFHFTDTGISGGSDRCGTIRMRIDAARTGGGGLRNYTVNSDDTTGQVLPAGYSVDIRDQGWVRGTTTLVEAASNVSAGGAQSEPAQYDESLYVRCTSGAASYVARALTVASSVGSLSGSTNSTTSATRDITFSNVVDERFAAAVTTVGWTVTVPNATLTGSADWTHTSTTDDTIDVDPRLTATLHFQVDDTTFALASHVASKQMLATQSGFLWAKITGSRAVGVNGVTIQQTLDPVGPGTTITDTATATTTQGGVVGVSGRLDWTASKPGGSWAWSVDATAPSDIDGATYLTSTDSVTMLAPNPAYAVLCGGGSGVDGQHMVDGDDFIVGGGLVNGVTGQLLTPGGTPSVVIARQTAAGKVEYLDVAYAWNEIVGAEQAYAHPMLAADLIIPGADNRVYLLVVPAGLVDWGDKSINALLKFLDSAGTPYIGQAQIFNAGGSNRHTGYALDPIGFALTGGISFR